jgi:hypothetical protein
VNYRSIIAALASGTMLGACSTPSNGSGASVPAVASSRVATAASVRGPSKGALVYVSWEGETDLTVYGGQPLKLVGGLNQESWGLATDSAGKIYIAGENTVYIFQRGAKKLVRTITRNLKSAYKVAVDGDGNVYVVDKRGVAIYRNGKEHRMKRIRTTFIQAIALDASNNLYVATDPGTIDVYPEDSTTLSRVITIGLDFPGAMTFDASGKMYVANVFASGQCGSSVNGGNVVVYAPGGTSPVSTIATEQGLCNPIAFAFDASGNLYVANYAAGQPSYSSVSVYAAGSLALIRTIMNGMNNPRAIAVDTAGALYVANQADDVPPGDMTVYAPQSAKLVQTLSNGTNNSAGDLVIGK